MVSSFKHAGAWLALLFCVSVLGCWEKPSQVAEEYNLAGYFVSRMGSYENRFPNAPITNLHEVLERSGTPYPAEWHHKLRSFGKHAGFKNSLFEKYVFVPTRFSNEVVHGDIVLLNAEPFPDRNGKYGRIIFSKWKPGWDGWMDGCSNGIRKSKCRNSFARPVGAYPKRLQCPHLLIWPRHTNLRCERE